MILTIILFVMVALSMSALWYYMYRFEQGERSGDVTETNTDAAAFCSEEEFMEVFNRFPDLQRFINQKNQGKLPETCIIPGLKTTKSILAETGEIHTCTSMTPQGIAVSEDYLLISAYCHEHKHHSVIYMIDKKSRTFLKEIVLPDKTHAGGLAYDPTHRMVWVSGYQQRKAHANAYRLENMEAYCLEERKAPLPYTYEEPLKELKRNSFMTCQKGYLYAGYFALTGESTFERYGIQGNGSLAQHEKYACISNEVQGIAFHKNEWIVCKSYGMKPSKVLVMRKNRIEDGIYDFRDKNAVAEYILPDRLECICYADGNVYLLFESAATPYRHRTYWAMDRVVVAEVGRESVSSQVRM